MTDAIKATRLRVQSIDILRGIVMVIMALDHVRDFFHKATVGGGAELATNPTDMETTTPVLFFTRWITHFCAPIFLFLAGTSAYLMSLRKTKVELSRFLVTRGLWLIFVEIVIITLGWTFNPFFNVIILQVIWAIGICMIILGLLVLLNYTVILVLAIVIFFGHNLLDYPSINAGLKGGFISDLLYYSNFSAYPVGKDRIVLIVYAFLPWLGAMLLGYCFGKLYAPAFDPTRRKKILLQSGIGFILLFLLLRYFNLYGDPVDWSKQPRGSIYTFLSFINVNKYPASLAFLSVTIGGGLIMLAFLETTRSRIASFFKVFGRVPMFYYILHFYLIHLLVVIFFFIGRYGTDRIIVEGNPFLFRPPEFGFNLWGVYAVWLFVVLALYPLCKKYDQYKTANVQKKWWLSYL